MSLTFEGNGWNTKHINHDTMRLCNHCDGEGELTFYILDKTCSVCKGTGYTKGKPKAHYRSSELLDKKIIYSVAKVKEV